MINATVCYITRPYLLGTVGIGVISMTKSRSFILFATIAALLSYANNSLANQSTSDLYKKHCAVCHGSNGDGRGRVSSSMTPPPTDFTSERAILGLTRDKMIKSIREGNPGTSMTGWKTKLSNTEIALLADHISDNFIKPAKAKKNASLPPELKKRLKTGEKIYTEYCSVCHGDYGQTGVWTQNNMASAPRNFTSDRVKSNLSRARMIEAVTLGVPGKAMMAFASRLTPTEIESVVDYVRFELMSMPLDAVIREAQVSTLGNASPQAGSATPEFVNSADYMKRPFPNGLRGDANEGRKIFVRICFQCHGVKGDGQGPRAFFINPKPRNFISSDSRRALNRPRIYKAVNGGLVGSVMPAWGKVFDQQQVANVSEFVFRAFIIGDMRGVSQQDIDTNQQKKN